MKNPYISIIIPVYNVEDYITNCINSIIDQRYTHFECLLVDDGSTDKSGFICDEYAKTDSRIKVIHSVNKGVSHARNLGLSYSHGDWLTFVDADDRLYPDALDIYVSGIQDDIDGVRASYIAGVDFSKQVASLSQPTFISLSKDDAIIELLNSNPFQGYIWNRLFRAEIISKNSIKFREDIYYKEDGLFLAEYISKCQKPINKTDSVVYFYFTRPNSAMNDNRNIFNEKYLTNLYARLEILSLVKTSTTDCMVLSLARDSVVNFYVTLLFLFNKYKYKNSKVRNDVRREVINRLGICSFYYRTLLCIVKRVVNKYR